MSGERDVSRFVSATVLATDIEQSQKLADAAEPTERGLAKRHFFRGTKRIVEAHHGRLEKFSGDGSLSVFPGDDGAADAVRCAWDLIFLGREVIDLVKAASLYELPLPRSGTRVGIATGVIELIQADWQEIDGPIIGIAVRLEGNAPSDGVRICAITKIKVARVAPELVAGARAEVLTVEQVKGARDPVKTWVLWRAPVPVV